jgi:HK97 family phage major capsid protein/HK97 family phage prohead protease
MPWHIGTSDSCPDSKPFAVIKDTDNSVAGCHATKAAAQKQLAALYANEPGAKSMAAALNSDELVEAPPARLPFPVTRAVALPVEALADGDGMPTMFGYFSTFGDWYEVDSLFEGHFLEQIGPRAFDKTISESRGQMKVLYDHGQDPQIGNKVLGTIEELRTDKVGPAYTVPLFDTSYNRDLAPGLKAGAYGSSFRFTVEKDVWDNSPEQSDHNPFGIPERTITEARVYEFGPVTFPANPAATAGVRSTTDSYYQRSRNPEQLETLLRTAQVARTPASAGAAVSSDEPPIGTPEQEPPPSDTPRAVEPELAEPAIPEPRSKTVEYTNREDMASRVKELEEALERQAVAFPGRLPEDEQTHWDTDVAELNELRADITAWDARQAIVEDNSQKPKNVERAFEAPKVNQINRKSDADIYDFTESRFRSEDEKLQTWRDDAMRATEVTTFPHPDTNVEQSRDRIAWLLDHHDSPDKELARRIKATGSPVYKRAFNKILKGQQAYLTPEEQRGTALAVGVDATGGFTVPFAFDPTIIAIGAHTGAINPYRRACRVVPIVGTDTWNALTATAVTATRTTEAAPAIEQGPTFAQPQYIVKRVQAQITYSLEMGQDRPDLSSEMAVLISEAKDNEEEASFATGVGTTVFPLGVGPVNGTAGAYTSITTATSVTLAAADFDAVEAALPVRHRFNAQWFLNRTSIRRAQSLETTGGKLFGGSQYPAVGNPALDSAGNTGLRLLMYPVNESPSLPTAQTANIVIGTLLNPDSYVIVDRIGMSVQLIPFIFGASQGNLVTGQQALYAMWRNDARPINVDAGRTLRYLT